MKKLVSFILLLILGLSICAYANNERDYFIEPNYNRTYSAKAIATMLYNEVDAPNVLELKYYSYNITREQFAELIVALYAKSQNIEKDDIIVTNNPFNDTKNMDVQRAYELGIVKGKRQNTFDANAFITREELAVMLVRFLKLKKISISTNNDLDLYSDKDDISAWAFDALAYCNQEKIMNGFNRQLMPKNKARVEDVIVMLNRIANKYNWLKVPPYLYYSGFYLPSDTEIEVEESTEVKIKLNISHNVKNEEKVASDLDCLLSKIMPTEKEEKQAIIETCLSIKRLEKPYLKRNVRIHTDDFFVDLEGFQDVNITIKY